MSVSWNPALYQSSHSFVWEFGRELVSLLAPKPGERILDLGCGTGQLTAAITAFGATVIGSDRSLAMLQEARRNYPPLPFAAVDATALPYDGSFDAVFSNAVLHWVKDAGLAAAEISHALKPGGRFIAEFGGHGNIAAVRNGISQALAELAVAGGGDLSPWYFPSIGEYAALLESHGLSVEFAMLFDRETALEQGFDGLAKWLQMFAKPFLDAVPLPSRMKFVAAVERHCASALLRDGNWSMDYRRIRIRARK
jgi:trans-aconitate 2-methyltransferase